MSEKQEYPKVVVGSSEKHKIFTKIRYLVKFVKQLDGGSEKDIVTVEYYDEEIQKLSGGSISVRFWID